MTREQIKALLPEGCSESVVSKLLDAIHAEIAPYKANATSAGNLKEQLEKAQGDLSTLQAKYEADVSAAKAASFDYMLKGVLQEKKARIPESVRGLLDLEAIKKAENPEQAAKDAVAALASGESTAFLFDAAGSAAGASSSGAPKITIGAPTGNGGAGMSALEIELRKGAGALKQ